MKLPPPSPRVPRLASPSFPSVGTGIIAAILVMLALPLTQWVSASGFMSPPSVTTIPMPLPPPVEPEPPKADEPEEKPDIKDFKVDPPMPSLDLIEASLNPVIGGFGPTQVYVPSGWEDDLDRMVFNPNDLTKPPRAVFQSVPPYPPSMRVARISGEVTVEFIVRLDGLVERPVAIRSTHQEFEEPALREVRRWRFEPGEREGRAVNSRVRIVIPFQAR